MLQDSPICPMLCQSHSQAFVGVLSGRSYNGLVCQAAILREERIRAISKKRVVESSFRARGSEVCWVVRLDLFHSTPSIKPRLSAISEKIPEPKPAALPNPKPYAPPSLSSTKIQTKDTGEMSSWYAWGLDFRALPGSRGD